NLYHLQMFIITLFQFFTYQNIFYKIYKLFLRSRRLNSEDSRRLTGVINVKTNSVFLFGHKGFVVISLTFWVTFVFDSSLGILLYSKSSFESYLANSPK